MKAVSESTGVKLNDDSHIELVAWQLAFRVKVSLARLLTHVPTAEPEQGPGIVSSLGAHEAVSNKIAIKYLMT